MQERELAGLQFLPRTAIALSIAATGLLHLNQHQQGEGHGPRVEVHRTEKLDDTAVYTEEIGEPKPAVHLVAHDGEPVLEQIETEAFQFAVAPYARKYDNDPSVGIVDKSAIETIDQKLAELKSQGWSNFTVRIFGRASAEDDIQDINAGTDKPSEHNQRLADLRRDMFIKQLRLDTSALNDANLVLEVGLEHTLSPEQMQSLHGLSDLYGFDSLGQMIDTWNKGDKVSPEIHNALDSILTPYRGVSVTIAATKFRQLPGQVTTLDEIVCVQPVREVEEREYHTEPWKATVPFLIPFPAFIPVFRRRSRHSASSAPLPLSAPYRPPKIDSDAVLIRSVSPHMPAGYIQKGVKGAASGGVASNVKPAEPREPISAEEEAPKEPIATVKDKKERKKWRLLIPIPIILLGGLSLGTCLDDGGKPHPRPTPEKTDPCIGLKTVKKVQGPKKIIKIVDGRRLPANIERVNSR